MASAILASEIPEERPSSMLTQPSGPETTRSNVRASRSMYEGFTTNFPSISPTRTADTGPFQGMSEIDRARDDANNARISGSFS